MAIVESAFSTAVANLIDDPNSALWTAANLTTLIAATIDEKWGQLLNFAPYYRSTLETLTTAPKLTSAGAIDIPQLANRFYRVQSIVRDGKVLDEARPQDLMMESAELISGAEDTYAFFGDLIYMFPLSGTTRTEIRYSSLPAMFSNAGTNLVWPDGHHSCLIFECAARAMTKGDREENARLMNIAKEGWDNLLSAVKRRNMPLVPYDNRSGIEFGSV